MKKSLLFACLFLIAMTSNRIEYIASQLRCLVCQAQTVAESKSEFSRIVKEKIALKIEQGQTDPEILAGLAEEYGEKILLKPSLNSSTFLLWIAPFIVFMLIGSVFYRRVRQ